MLRIKIGARLRPYSHIPGMVCLLPGTTTRMTVYPTKIVYDDLSGAFPVKVKEVDFARTGPVQGFTVQQDLERGRVSVWGHAQEGYFQFIEEGKAPEQIERLSLGSHKAQDQALVQRRLDFTEIFPLWFQLGQMLPPLTEKAFEGSLVLLDDCQKTIASNKPETILTAFEKVYLAGFEGLLSPRLNDEDYQGLGVSPASTNSASPLWLLKKGTELIRSLFINFSGEKLTLLPALPPQFHSGRLLGARLEGIGTLDMEWSKKEMRRCVIHCSQTTEIAITATHQKSFRLNKQKRHSSGAVLQLTPGEWQLDQFMHL